MCIRDRLVFWDLSTPKNDGTFSVYKDIRKKLIERGIPESEVKFIHDDDTDMKLSLIHILRLRKASVKKIHISHFRGRRWRSVSGNLSEWTDT